MKLTCYQATHIGKREDNQDSYAQVMGTDWACYIVTDGLGGHFRGDLAAKEVCQSMVKHAPRFSDQIQKDPVLGMSQLIECAIHEMQNHIREAYQEIDTQTTLAMAWLNQDHIITAHVGDSRVYRLNKSQILWRTPDHTEVQALFEAGKITEADFSSHPLQNHLLRSVNMFEIPDADLFVHPALEQEETLILCTDGFWGNCQPEDLISLAKNNGSLSKKLETLIDSFVTTNPHCDNITVQVVKHQI